MILNWKTKAIELATTGMSWRKVAKKINKPKSTVSDALRKHFKGYVKPIDTKDVEKPVNALNGGESLNKKVKHLIIADTQVKPEADMAYLKALSNYILEKRPDVIVHIGDHFDMESLSSYDRGKRSFEGRRVKADLEAGYSGMDALVSSFKDVSDYNPRMVFCLGNHEERIDRFSNDHPELTGFLGTDMLNLEKFGWEVFPFLKPVEIDGIYYVHYLSNPFNGRPYGGNALNQLKTVGRSFVVGHKQCLDIAIRPTLDGRMQLGIINGAFYPHFEEYKGYQSNNHFRGITVLHDVKVGYGDPMMVSLEYLMREYG